MAKRRVYEIADELGFNKQELVTKINSLGLGFSVGNYMTVLSPTEVEALKRALKNEKKPKAESKPAASRKRASKSDSDSKSAESAPAEPVATTVIRRRRKVEPEPTAEEPAAEAAGSVEEAALPLLRRRRKADDEAEAEVTPIPVLTEEERAAAEAAEPAAAVEPEEQAAEVAAEAVESPAAEPAAEETEAPETPADEVAAPAATTDEAAPAEVPAASAPEPAQPEAAEPAVAAEREEQPTQAPTPQAPATPGDSAAPPAIRPGAPPPRPAAPKRGGAKILGKISESVLLDRLAAEGKDFSPGPSRRTESDGGAVSSHRTRRSRTKRVVEGRDLYDPKDRRGKRRPSRGRSRSDRRQRQQQQQVVAAPTAEHKRNIRIEDVISVGDLAHQMGIKAAQVAMKLIEGGMMATVNTTLDFDTAAYVAEEFGYTVENVAFDMATFFDTTPDPEDNLKPRPPVVTVMGHVDHGKTSLLDAIRQASVATGEAGGITQHIGAYTVGTERGEITFLDTPGHEAFSALRARGAKATDIVVLVVAADDGVMPQTVEAINHSRDAKVPIIVAINKIDKPAANPDRVRTALAEYELIPEEWGGSTLFVEVSAKQRLGIDDLLETLALQAEIEELKANPDRDAQGLVIEAELDIGRGPVATVLVQRGTLKQGDIIVSGRYYGRVRTMNDDRGRAATTAGPSRPVEITGLSGIPEAGEPFFVVSDEKHAKRVTEHVATQRRKETMASRAKEMYNSLEDLSAMIRQGELKELKVILKGDVHGSVEALRESLAKLGNEEVRVKIIHTGVGGITENDVNLAASSEAGAVIVGFNVRPDHRAAEVAEKYNVQILTHNIIYDAIEQVRSILEGLLSPIVEERVIGHAEVRDTFHAPRVGTIAGCYVQDGVLRRNARARLLRDGRVVYESTLASLRRFKDDVREVKSGFECGTSLENFNDIKVGDIIEAYEFHEISATLQ